MFHSLLQVLLRWPDRYKVYAARSKSTLYSQEFKKCFQCIWKEVVSRLTPIFRTRHGAQGVMELACEQALLFGRVKRVSRERASERRSREGLGRSLTRSREARFACPNRRACSQAIMEGTFYNHALGEGWADKMASRVINQLACEQQTH